VPKRSQEHLDARREQILDAARSCFAQYGYTGATVARLEEATGLSRGAIFNYFESKQGIFIAVAIDVSQRYTELVATRGLEAAVRAMAAEDPEVIGMLIEVQSQLRHDEEFVRKFEQAAREIATLPEWFEEQQRTGAFRDDLPSRELARFASMVLNGLSLRVAEGEKTDIEATLTLLNDALAPR
jgi:AcrR family transcriptional regulator